MLGVGMDYGFARDYLKALELWHRAGELGYAIGYHNIGIAYRNGRGVGIDMKKARHYWELAAMGGISEARHSLGLLEEDAGNMDRATKHLLIAARNGYSKSVSLVKQLYLDGHARKDDYTMALRAYQSYLAESKSSQRDEAEAAADYHDDNKYIVVDN